MALFKSANSHRKGDIVKVDWLEDDGTTHAWYTGTVTEVQQDAVAVYYASDKKTYLHKLEEDLVVTLEAASSLNKSLPPCVWLDLRILLQEDALRVTGASHVLGRLKECLGASYSPSASCEADARPG